MHWLLIEHVRKGAFLGQSDFLEARGPSDFPKPGEGFPEARETISDHLIKVKGDKVPKYPIMNIIDNRIIHELMDY